MATSLVRSILTNLGVFIATNGVRRNVASFSNNFITLDGGVDSGFRNLPASATWTFQPPSANTSLTVVQTSGPILADVTLRAVAANPPSVPSGRLAQSFQLIVNRTLMLDDDVQSIVFTNTGTTEVQVTTISG